MCFVSVCWTTQDCRAEENECIPPSLSLPAYIITAQITRVWQLITSQLKQRKYLRDLHILMVCIGVYIVVCMSWGGDNRGIRYLSHHGTWAERGCGLSHAHRLYCALFSHVWMGVLVMDGVLLAANIAAHLAAHFTQNLWNEHEIQN